VLLVFGSQQYNEPEKILYLEALAKVIFVILSAAKDLDSSVAYGSLRMTDM